MSTNECYVYFAFDGEEFEPNEVTEYLGIHPSLVRRKGEKIPNQRPKFSSWQLSTEKLVREVIEVDAMAAEVINVLEPKTELINEIREKLNLITRLEVVMHITTDDSQSTPALGFQADQVAFLAAVGAYIDVDIYRT